MSNVPILVAGLASIVLEAKRIRIDPRRLKFHRSRVEPTDPEELKARNQRRLDLADSWLESPINDIIVRDGDYAIADGNERVAGILLRGVTEIPVTLLPASTPDSQLDEISLLTDFHKTALKPVERAALVKRHYESTGAKKGDIAAKFRIDSGYVTKLLSLYDCPPEVQQAAEAGRLGVDDWYACSKSDQPLETLRIKLAGGNRAAVHRSAQKPKADAVRTAKLKVKLVTGQLVTVAGQDASLEEVLEALEEAKKLVKGAISKGLNASTAAKVWADMAAAAG